MAVIKIQGMSCQHCVASVTTALQAVEGIRHVEVDLQRGEARYTGDVAFGAVKAAIEKIGFEVVG